MEASVRVSRGESIEIPLRIYGTRNQTLEFRIKTEPQSGTLSPIRRVDKEVGAVTYTPTSNPAILRDRFSYAVRSKEGVSAAVDIQIAIIDAAPRLITPAELEFKPRVLGEVNMQTLNVANEGGGIAEGDLLVESPWQVEGSARYRLEAGKSQLFSVRFVPEKAGAFRGELRYSSHPERATSLIGEARGPIAFSPPKITLLHPTGAMERTGSFEVIAPAKASPKLVQTTPVRVAAPAPPTSTPRPPDKRIPSPPSEDVRVAKPLASPALAMPLAELPFSKLTSTSVAIHFPEGHVIHPRYKVELRELTLDNGELVIHWIDHPGFKTATVDGRIIGTLTGLAPGTFYVFRITGVLPKAETAPFLREVTFATPGRAKRWRVTPARVLGALLVVCLGLVVWKKLRVR